MSANVQPGNASRPAPQPTCITERFWSAAEDGELLYQECDSCGARQHYPRLLCRVCGGESVAWRASSGQGEVYTYTVVRRPAGVAFADDVPYVCALIELDEGVRLLSNIVDCDVEQVGIGMRVEAVFGELAADRPIPVFRPVQQ